MQFPHEYSLQLATPAHVPLLAAIESAAAGIFPPGSLPEHIRSDSVPKSVLFEAVQEGLLWVALTADGRPVGYALVQMVEDAALLAQIDVHPDHMRKGIGSALIALLVKHLKSREKTTLYLTTFRHVPWNAPLYAKLGFEVLNKEEVPLFLKTILNEEKRHGLTNRVAMLLPIQFFWSKAMNAISRSVATQITAELLALKNDEQAVHLMRFFKTGPGQYGEGDRFLGIKVPVVRSSLKTYRNEVALVDCDTLLDSEWHEIRLAGLLLMVGLAQRFAKQNDRQGLQELVALYDRRLDRVNNWDLVDLSVRDIMGAYWKSTGTDAEERRRFLTAWANSGHLWSERSAMVSVYALQRMGSLDETFWLAEHFIDHRHDLMHKAAGWMLREAGKIDRDALRRFLAVFYKRLPRTALRYAIEHMTLEERQKWMAK